MAAFPPSRDREREEVEIDKEMKRARKTYTKRVGIYIKIQRPEGRETDKLETAKKKQRQKIYRLRAEIACGPC